MTQTSMVHSVKNALVDQLSAQESLAGVKVSSADLGANTPLESFTLADVTDWSQTWDALGNLRKAESFTIEAFLLIVKPGADETTIRAARSRAVAILAAVEVYLRNSMIHGDTVDGITLQQLVKRAELNPRSMIEWTMTEGRACMIEVGITITARLRRGED